MAISDARGTALLEALPTSGLLVVLVGGLLLAAYLIFTKTWVQYQSEQALYCAMQEQTSVHCQASLNARLHSILPWGDLTTHIQGSGNRWTVEVTWQFQGYSFHISKQLDPQAVLAPKALLW